MAETSLVFSTQPTKIESIALDAALREVHSGEVEVTEHPVEQGSNITDHTRPKPDRLTIDAIVTQRTRVVEAFGVSFVSSSLEDSRQGAAGYAETAYAKLVELKDKGSPITVVTQIRTYDDMILTSLSVPRDSKTGDALLFTASFQRVILVKNKLTRKVVSRDPKVQPKNKTGKQAPKTDTSASKKSILKTLDNSTGRGLSKLLTPGA
jgi:hypothetical protein